MKTSILLLMMNVGLLSLISCAPCDQARPDPGPETITRNNQASSQDDDPCLALNNEIENAMTFSDRFKYSRYAAYYQAMGREKRNTLLKLANDIGCVVSQQDLPVKN